jgi:type II secretory pathway pseudopilin PulG
MQGGLKSRNCKTAKLQNPQRGYMLITLMLALALMTIALLTVLPEIKQQVRRDREEEMRHRGTAYMRAIQHFYKKFGRYPTRVEELENTNNLRFLRKRYKDPINIDAATGQEKDFKFLHQTDISLNGAVLGQTPGQSLLPGQGGAPGSGGFGGAQGGGGLQQTGSQTLATGNSGNSSSGNPSDAEGNSNPTGSSSGSPSSPSNSSSNSGSGFNGPVFGGGPIVGVASTSKATTIRVFYDKNHYKDWLFIYFPQANQGGLLTGPVQPGMPSGNLGIGAPGGLPGQGQGLTPNGGQPFVGQSPQTPQTPQNPGQTPPEQ